MVENRANLQIGISSARGGDKIMLCAKRHLCNCYPRFVTPIQLEKTFGGSNTYYPTNIQGAILVQKDCHVTRKSTTLCSLLHVVIACSLV